MTTNLFLFVFLLGFLMCAWMKKFLKNNHLIVFILINLLVSAKTKEKRKYKKRDNEENIYTLSKTLPHGSLSYYYYKNKTYVVFSATLDDLCSLAATAKKILCVIITVCNTQSLVLLLLTAAYLSRKIIRKNDRKIVLQWMLSSQIKEL